jgi:release factor glutamine methyltransferase
MVSGPRSIVAPPQLCLAAIDNPLARCDGAGLDPPMQRDGQVRPPATFRQIVARIADRLAVAGVETARGDAWLLLAAVTGCPRARLMAAGSDGLTAEQELRLEAMVRRRSRREPMAYILSEREFWSLPLRITPAVLIPRPESETVVDAALAQVEDRGARLRILDLGTGSGCLLLALLSELPNASGLGIDLSAEALAVARANAGHLGLAGRARFEPGRWGAGLEGAFDLIVANPPYVGAAALAGLEPEVRDFEPRIALIAGPDGLDAYRALIPDCVRLLAEGGSIALEIGQGQGDAVAGLLAGAGLDIVERRSDLAAIERCLVARPKPAAGSERGKHDASPRLFG